MSADPAVGTGGDTGADQPSIVVLGAGFAGMAAARSLVRTPVRVVLVDRNNFHTFRPLLYQVATAGLSPGDVAYPVRAAFGRWPNVSFRHATVQGIDPVTKTVTLEHASTLHYDRLVLATGSVASYHGVAGAQEWALPLYSLDDARHLRNRVLRVLEHASEDPGRVEKRGLSFAVVGSGPTGVETAGALVELLETSVKHDRLRLGANPPIVVLVDALERPLTGFSDRSGRYAAASLVARGVQLKLGDPVADVTQAGLQLAGGESVPADLVVWAGGVTVHGTPASWLPGQKGPGGRVEVDDYLRARGCDDIFVAGDAAAARLSQTDERTCPQLAQLAIQSGRHASQQAWRSLQGDELEPFTYKDKGIMATIGRRAAVAEIALPGTRRLSLRGTAGWAAWLFLHLMYLISFRNRLIVLVNWAWRYLRWPSGPRLIMGDLDTAPPEGDRVPLTRPG